MATITERRTRKSGRSFLAQVRIAGYKPTARAFASRRDAKRWAEQTESELRKQRERGNAIRSDAPKMTVGDIIREYLDDPETQSLRTYRDLSDLLAWWTSEYGGERVLRLNVVALREARKRLRKDGRAPATVNRYLSAMRSCWNFARAAGIVPLDQSWPLRLMLTEPKGRTRFLSDEELTRLNREAAEYSPLMRAAISVSLGCGVRAGELLRLTWADVDFERQRLRILIAKNKTSRAVHLPSSAAHALRALKRQPMIGSRVFLNSRGEPLEKGGLEKHWRTIRAAADLHDFRWHDLRHSCASILAQNGATLLEIGSVLGHKSPAVTQRYSHLVEGKPVTGHDALDRKLRGDP
ncbi:MAG: site-specific integrase [Steroidobacteraceae bacterium]